MVKEMVLKFDPHEYFEALEKYSEHSFDLFTPAQVKLVRIFIRLHLVKYVAGIVWSHPLNPDNMWGYGVVLDGSELSMWLLDKIGDLLMDDEGRKRQEMLQRYLDSKHTNEEVLKAEAERE